MRHMYLHVCDRIHDSTGKYANKIHMYPVILYEAHIPVSIDIPAFSNRKFFTYGNMTEYITNS